MEGEQLLCFDQAIAFATATTTTTTESPQNTHMLSIIGNAGTGKTFLTCHIIHALIQSKRVCVAAYTNKAVKNIRQEYSRMFQHSKDTKFITTTKLFNKQMVRDADGKLEFVFPENKNEVDEELEETEEGFVYNQPKFVDDYDVIFIDEASMIPKEEFKILQKTNTVKIIFIGDDAQLPPVNARRSIVFKNVPNTLKLTHIRRTNHPDIQQLSGMFRKLKTFKGMLSSFGLIDARQLCTELGHSPNIVLYCNPETFKQSIREHFKQECANKHIITYSNPKCTTYTEIAREQFADSRTPYVCGERIVFREHYTVVTRTGVSRYVWDDDSGRLYDRELMKLVRKPRLYYAKTDEAFVRSIRLENLYHDLTHQRYNVWCISLGYDQLIFQIHEDDRVRYKRNVYKVKMACVERAKPFFEMMAKFPSQRQVYKSRIKQIWTDYNIGEKAFDVPIDYGYAQTVYKSQGSTYQTVFIDTRNILKCPVESTIKNKERMLMKRVYTAITRTSCELHLLL